MRANLMLCLLIVQMMFMGCNSATSTAGSGSNNAGTGGTTTIYTYANASPAITVLNEGIVQAALTTDNTATAYKSTPVAGTTVFHLASYTPQSPDTPSSYVLTGTLTQVTGTPNTLNGTVNFTGGSVSQIQYNNVTSTPSGTYTITFGGLVTYTFNLATDSFTIN